MIENKMSDRSGQFYYDDLGDWEHGEVASIWNLVYPIMKCVFFPPTQQQYSTIGHVHSYMLLSTVIILTLKGFIYYPGKYWIRFWSPSSGVKMIKSKLFNVLLYIRTNVLVHILDYWQFMQIVDLGGVMTRNQLRYNHMYSNWNQSSNNNKEWMMMNFCYWPEFTTGIKSRTNLIIACSQSKQTNSNSL